MAFTDMNPPKAKKIKKVFSEFGHTRIDNYYWLNDKDDPEVTGYLEAENAYTQKMMQPARQLQENIYNEIISPFRYFLRGDVFNLIEQVIVKIEGIPDGHMVG